MSISASGVHHLLKHSQNLICISSIFVVRLVAVLSLSVIKEKCALTIQNTWHKHKAIAKLTGVFIQVLLWGRNEIYFFCFKQQVKTQTDLIYNPDSLMKYVNVGVILKKEHSGF